METVCAFLRCWYHLHSCSGDNDSRVFGQVWTCRSPSQTRPLGMMCMHWNLKHLVFDISTVSIKLCFRCTPCVCVCVFMHVHTRLHASDDLSALPDKTGTISHNLFIYILCTTVKGVDLSHFTPLAVIVTSTNNHKASRKTNTNAYFLIHFSTYND